MRRGWRSVGSELQTTQVSLDPKANANHDAGTSPKLDVLRAQVDNQNLQQQLIVAQNQLAKDKLALARTIGLPLAQEFQADRYRASYAALDSMWMWIRRWRRPLAKNRKDLQAMGGAAEGGEGFEEGGALHSSCLQV